MASENLARVFLQDSKSISFQQRQLQPTSIVVYCILSTESLLEALSKASQLVLKFQIDNNSASGSGRYWRLASSSKPTSINKIWFMLARTKYRKVSCIYVSSTSSTNELHSPQNKYELRVMHLWCNFMLHAWKPLTRSLRFCGVNRSEGRNDWKKREQYVLQHFLIQILATKPRSAYKRYWSAMEVEANGIRGSSKEFVKPPEPR
jgi:hypothetical protein